MMGDFYVDDQFFDHPKALAAGEDAANLYVRGLAWAHRHNTGRIPKNAVPTLTTKKAHRMLTAALVTQRLWHDRGDHYEINDWEVRNAKSIAKRTQAQAAAKQRWANADAHADASTPHMQNGCDRYALPTKEPRNQGLSSSSLLLTHDQPSSTVGGGIFDQAIKILARRDIARQPLGRINNPQAWLAKAETTLKQRHTSTYTDTAERYDFATPDLLADYLEPPPPPPKPEARQPLRDERPPCDTCHGAGMILDGTFAQPCPNCNTSSASL